MKTTFNLTALAVLCFPCFGVAQNIVVTDEELIVPGRFVPPYTTPSVVVIDRASGQWRRGDLSATTVMDWIFSGSSGMDRVLDAAVALERNSVPLGAHPDTGGDLIVAVSQFSQRMSRIIPTVAIATSKESVRPIPTGVVAFGTGSGFNSPIVYPSEHHGDIWYTYAGSGNASLPALLEKQQNVYDGNATFNGPAPSPLRHGRRTRFSTAATQMAWLQDLPGSTTMRFYNITTVELANMPGLPRETKFCTGLMDATSSPVFVFYDKYSPTVRWTKFPAAPTGTLAVPTTTFTAGGPVAFAMPINQGTASGVLLQETLTGKMELWQFTGSGFAKTQTMTPAAGQRFTGAFSPAGRTELVLLNGSANGGGTSGFARYLVQANGTYATPAAGNITPLKTRSSAHVFYFTAEPALNPGATLVQAQSSPEWTLDNASLSSIRAQTYGTATQGLTGSTVRTLTPPVGATFLTPNQYRADTSGFALTNEPVTSTEPTIRILPKPGFTETATGAAVEPIAITFVSEVGNVINYQINNGQTITWDGNPVVLPASTAPMSYRITYLARATGGARSRLHVADYAFGPATPTSIGPGPDTNNNGLADDWELHYGLTDPNGDPDGDGLNNLTEQNLGSNPLILCGIPASLGLTYQAPNQIRLTLVRPLQANEVLETSTQLQEWSPVTLVSGATQVLQPIDGVRRWWRIRGL